MPAAPAVASMAPELSGSPPFFVVFITTVSQRRSDRMLRRFSTYKDSLHCIDWAREPPVKLIVDVIDAKLTGTCLLLASFKSNMLRAFSMLKARSDVFTTSGWRSNMRLLKRLASTITMFGLLTGTAFGQETDEDSGRAIKYKQRTEIDFDSVDVSGDLIKPQGMLLMDVKRKQFNPLIRLREDFNEEMKQSVDEVK